MRKLPLILCTIIGALAGCNGNLADRTPENDFPEVMVGVWETERDPVTRAQWAIRFEEDGSVEKLIHKVAGPVDLAVGGASREGIEGSEFTFVLSDVQSRYSPRDNTVTVVIPVEYFRIALPAGVLQGDMTDTFTGPVPEQGSRIWRTRRTTESTLEGAEMSSSLLDLAPDEVVFYKVDLEEVRERAAEEAQ